MRHFKALAFIVVVVGYAIGAAAAVLTPPLVPKPQPTPPCLTQTLAVDNALNGVILVDCSIREHAVIETPAPAGATFHHGVWIVHVYGPKDGTYSYRP